MAEDADQADKTEQPTQRKLDQARERGQMVNSREVGHLFAIGAIAFGLLVVAPWSAARLGAALRQVLAHAGYPREDPAALGWLIVGLLAEVGICIAPLIALGVAASLGATLMQQAVTFSAEPLLPKLARLSPLAGLKRICSLNNLVEFGKGVVKLVLVAAVGWSVLWPERDLMARLGEAGAGEVMAILVALVVRLLGAIAALLVVVAALDWAWQRHHHIDQLKMSREEVRQEHRENEGDPVIKQRLRALRMERARRRMMTEVPKATVVITNPTHYAVALSYDAATPVPTVVAKGTDLIAKRIRELAAEHHVPVIENPPLARALHAQVEIGAAIPASHYQAVAEIIALVMRLRRSPGRPPPRPDGAI